MKALVTGANGFLGSRAVEALRAHGHAVRGLVRPGANLDGLEWARSTGGQAASGTPDGSSDRVEVFRADLATDCDLSGAFDGIDCLVHVAAATRGNMQEQLAATVEGTRRLLEAMAGSPCRRVVLVSSFAVYDWSRVAEELTEESPLLIDAPEGTRMLEELGAYAAAKSRQEKLAREMAVEGKWDLRVVRPGLIWGPSRPWHGAIGVITGWGYLLFGLGRVVPITHVENCADAVAAVAESDAAAGGTFNLVDGHAVTAQGFAADHRARSMPKGVIVSVPYWAGMLAARVGSLFPSDRLPGFLVPSRFRARFKPVECEAKRLRAVGWKPLMSYEMCLDWTYGRGGTTDEHR